MGVSAAKQHIAFLWESPTFLLGGKETHLVPVLNVSRDKRHQQLPHSFKHSVARSASSLSPGSSSVDTTEKGKTWYLIDNG